MDKGCSEQGLRSSPVPPLLPMTCKRLWLWGGDPRGDMQGGQVMTQAQGRGASCSEWFESRLQVEAALRMWPWVLPTDQGALCPSVASCVACL